jgi:hypothetical protein
MVMVGRGAVVVGAHVEEHESVTDFADMGIVRAARVEEIAAARGQRDLGEFIGATARVGDVADNL